MNLRNLLGAIALVLVGVFITLSGAIQTQAAPDKEKDKTLPVITELRTDPVGDTNAVIRWATDESSDSDIKYGVDSHMNMSGPRDTTLVLSHAIALSGLAPQTTYSFCVTSRDESNNKAEECGTFLTMAVPPPPTPTGGGSVRPTRATLAGYSFPGAGVSVELRALPSMKRYAAETISTHDGSFQASFDRFPAGLYTFLITATDTEGRMSSRKGIRFELDRGEAFSALRVVMPPTIGLPQASVSWGDDLVVVGYAMPRTGVVVDVSGMLHEVESDRTGAYRLAVDSSRHAPGTITLRARSAVVSALGPDYSPSITARITASKAPAADIDADGSVTSKDLSAFFAAPRDLTGDGRITIEDISVFLSAF